MKPPLYGAYKIGELADEARVSVRTLHYYEEIGLIKPSARTASGHRLYSLEDALRLQQIKTLQKMGFTLEEVRVSLDEPEYSPIELIRMQREKLTEQIKDMERLRDQLALILWRYDRQDSVSTEEILQVLEVMHMVDMNKYYTPEQLDQLAKRREMVGEERIRQVEQEWKDLFAAFEKARVENWDPAGEDAQALARKCRSLVEEFTGGDPGITQSVTRLHQENPNILNLDPKLSEYMQKVMGKCQ